MSLSKEQEYAFDKYKKGENLLLTGPGGTGKSKLIRNFINYSISINQRAQATALTGCAAILLGMNAKTIHSWSGIKIAKGKQDQIIEQALRSKRVRQRWLSVKTLIIDEASMMSKKIFDLLNALGRRIRYDERPFGGIQIVCVCDFYQLPPVGSPNEPDTEQFCFESKDWYSVFPLENHVVLTKIFRQRDAEYIKILNEIRIGELSDSSKETLEKYVNREYKKEDYNDASLTKLFPLRNRVDLVNKAMFNQLEEEPIKYSLMKNTDNTVHFDSTKKIDDDKMRICNNLSISEIEMELQQLINSCPCVQELELKKGAAVMCNANIDMEMGICNGSQGVIIDLVGENKRPKVKFTNGVIMVMDIHHWQSEEYPTLSVSQYPLQLAWALTIHKIQGTTLKMAQMDIGKDIFAYGQTYVALSRIESLDGLYLSSFMSNRVRAHPKVKEFYSRIPEIEIPDNREFELEFKSEENPEIKKIDGMFKEFEYKEEPDTKIIVIKKVEK